MVKKKLIMLFVIAVLAFAILAVGCAKKKPTIKIADMGWSSNVVVANIVKQIIENDLGYDVEFVATLWAPATFAALEAGEVDVYMEAWRPNQDSFIAKYVDEKKVAEIVATSYSNAPQGFVVPKYVIEGDAERGIAPMIDPADIIEVNGVKTFSVDKLNNYKSLFNIDADANGELIGGPAGWIATDINDWKIASYGLEYDQTIQDEWVAWALFTAAIEKGEPIVGYMYAPTSIMFKFDFVWLQEPEYTAEKWADFETWKAADRPTQATAEWQPGKACAYPGADVVVIVTDELKDQAPEVYDFLKNWSIPLEDVTELAAKIELDKLPAGKVAADWVEANRAKVDAMLGK